MKTCVLEISEVFRCYPWFSFDFLVFLTRIVEEDPVLAVCPQSKTKENQRKTQSAPSAPKGHLGVTCSPILGEPFFPLYSCYQAHDLWVPRCTYCSKTRFERPNAFWGSQNTQKRRTRMKKCDLGHFGAKSTPAAPL